MSSRTRPPKEDERGTLRRSIFNCGRAGLKPNSPFIPWTPLLVHSHRKIPLRLQPVRDDTIYQFKLSTTIAIPCPPPMHAVARPYFFLRRRNSYSSVITSLVPVAPSGCPKAI